MVFNEKERRLFADFYKLCQKFWMPSMDPKENSDFNLEAHRFAELHSDVDAKFVRDIVMALAYRRISWYQEHMKNKEAKIYGESEVS